MIKRILSGIGNGLDLFRRIIVNLLFVFILLGIVAAFIAQRPKVPDGGALLLDPKGELVEQIIAPNPQDLLFSRPRVEQSLMKDLLDAIHLARDDSRIKLMVLKLDEMGSASLSKLQDLHRAILDFRKGGKRVIVSADQYSQAQYYLASAADEVYLNPMGFVMLTGLGLYRNYFKDALDRLKVDMHVFAAGRYKSAAEPLTRNNMSAAARKANSVWMNQFWQTYKHDVSEARGIKSTQLQGLVDHPARLLRRYRGSQAMLAWKSGLVDKLATHQQVEGRLIALSGEDRENHTFRQIAYRAYLRAVDGKERHLPGKSRNKLAIVVASGAIMDGTQPAGTIGGDSLANVLRSARQNDEVKALVLRVDSPGGSAMASERIRQEVERIRQAGKPVVISMGGVAASGGYWISMSADEIWASPLTLTGSIGVISLLPNLHRGLENMGIHSDGIGTSPIAGAMRLDRPLDPEIVQVFQQSVEHIYHEFVRKTATGRHMKEKQVDHIAQGRVWSGADAVRIGLIDKLGGLDDAIAAAAERAGISGDYERVYLKKKSTLQELLFEDFFSGMQTWFGNRISISVPGADLLPAMVRELHILTSAGRGIYAYCPCGMAEVK